MPLPPTKGTLLSPDNETFSTPPTTPGPANDLLTCNGRRISRPSSLLIDHSRTEWRPDIVLDTTSPVTTVKVNGITSPFHISNDRAFVPHNSASLLPQIPTSPSHAMLDVRRPTDSPCFIHSHLDKGASLTDWLRNKPQASTDNSDLGVAKSLQRLSGVPRTHSQTPYSPFSASTNGTGSGIDSDDEYAGNLTKQLAETAVGVREMSKQLGRARVQSNIQNVLIVTKARDNRLIKLTRELALYLMLKHRRGSKRGLVVYVDTQLRHSRRFDADGIRRDHPELFVPFPHRRASSSVSVSSASSSSLHKEEGFEEGQLRYWTRNMCNDSPHLFDFVVTLGGDGTVLFTSWLFQRIVPPVLPFALGSLGFLTNFDFSDHQAVMDSVVDNGIRVNLRMRFTCTVYRAVSNEEGKGRKAVKKAETGEIIMKNIEKGGWEALEGGWTGGFTHLEGKCGKDKEIMCFTTRPVETFEVINDLVVDRGPSPYVSLLELFGDEHHMTTVQADGLTVSTPTGSTAYSLSAGGSLVHPEIPALLITPICPHTLSFRPMLLPDSMELRICVPYNSRSTAWASFDGRGRVELKQGDHIKVTASKYPFPTVCADKQSTDWFHAISRTLKWNERERQKSFVVVEEGPSKPKRRLNRGTITADTLKSPTSQVVEEDEDEDEISDEDDKFDIDDSAAETDPVSDSGKRIPEMASDSRRESTPSNKKSPRQVARSKERRLPSKSRSKSRSRSRSSAMSSGVNSPNRFSTQQPHPPGVSPRHVGFDVVYMSSDESSPSSELVPSHSAQEGARDDIYALKQIGGKSRIPQGRDFEFDSAQTPTVTTLGHGRGRGSRSRSIDHPGHRAFAVWGQDESDSNNSDSDF